MPESFKPFVHDGPLQQDALRSWIDGEMANYRKHPRESATEAARLATLADAAGFHLESARLHLLIARASDSFYDPILGLEATKQALTRLDLVPETDAGELRAMAFAQQAIGQMHLGNPRLAIDLLLTGLKLAEKAGSAKQQQKILINLAYVFEREGKRDRAIEYCHRVFRVLERHPDREIEAENCNNLAWYLAPDRPAEAMKYIDRCLEITSHETDPRVWANAIDTKAEVLVKLGDYEEALQLFLESSRLQRGQGQHVYHLQSLIRASKSLVKLGRCQEAREVLERALGEAMAHERRPVLDELHFELGEVLLELGEPAEAAQHFRHACGHKEDIAKRHFEQSLQAVEAKNQLDWSAREAELLRIKHEELLLEKQKAEDANRLKSQFLANMSHEIRTPMNGVIGITELLGMTSLTSEQMEYVRTIQGCGNSLLVIINDILDLSKIEAGRLDLESLAVPLCKMLRDIESLYQGQAAQKNVRLVADLGDNDSLLVLGDEIRLRQIVANLVSNAVKFTDAGEVGIRLRRISETGTTCRFSIEVSDTGIGIPEDQLGRVFDSFTQADGSTTRKFGGTGLGLTIASKLAEKMNGSIRVSSEVDKGSTFTVELELPTASLSVTDGTLQFDESHHEPEGIRVLLAEDHPVNALVVTRQLKRFGCDVVHAANGQEAVDHLQRARFDLVLMDVQMPVLDGYLATAAIREAEWPDRRTPIIGLTANAMPEHRQACLDAGMDDYLSKPVRLAQLGELLEKWTDHEATLTAA